AGGASPPLFCVHPIGGEVLCYRDLARALGAQRPVYALQAPGVDGRSAPLQSVEEMAAHYLTAMRTVQAHGPYFVGGWSVGGLVAFEMARQLEIEGEEVGLLALIDSLPPGHDAYSRATPASFALDRSAQLLPGDAPASTVKALFDVYVANGRAGARYHPSA